LQSEAARADLLRLINGFEASQAIHVAASLGLADLIGAGTTASADLAAATTTDPNSLYRLMRALAAVGVMREEADRHFGLTPMGEYLRSDVSGTHGPMAKLIGRPNFWLAWGNLLQAVRDGTIAFDHVHGCNVWSYRADHPEESAVFDSAMAAGTERFADSILDAYDFSRFRHAVDVGGGDGAFLAKILAAHPSMNGTLFDQPHVITKAMSGLCARGLSKRCRAQGGDFFVSVPEGGDVYLLKWVLHDWKDADCVAILQRCRAAMQPAARLLLVEFLVQPPNTGPEGKFMDLMMMVMNGGRERTREEIGTLLATGGFRITDVKQAWSLLSVIECAPA
jgi:hypothetical protein